MKKYLLFLATAAIVASCSNNDLRNDLQNEQVEIGFSTFTGKLTRAENSTASTTHGLSTHHTAFKVWGYKTVGTNPSNVFVGTEVNYVNSKWTYSPLRFWDKSATNYKFFAAAPATESWSFANDKFTLSNFSVDGATIAASSSINADANFGAKDIMISEDVTVSPTDYTATEVQLNFIHLLTRLNIGVKKATPALENYVVKLTSLKVFNLVDGGSFSEATAAVQNGSIARWSEDNSVSSNSNAGYGYTGGENPVVVTTSLNYIYQSLFIPQQIDYVANTPLNGTGLGASSKPYLNIQYDLYASDGTTLIDSYSYFFNLADMFNGNGENSTANVKLCEGWMNNLNITIEPVAINFAADIYEWKPTTDTNVNVPGIN